MLANSRGQTETVEDPRLDAVSLGVTPIALSRMNVSLAIAMSLGGLVAVGADAPGFQLRRSPSGKPIEPSNPTDSVG